MCVTYKHTPAAQTANSFGCKMLHHLKRNRFSKGRVNLWCHSPFWWGCCWGPPLWCLHPGPLGRHLSSRGAAARRRYPPGGAATPAGSLRGPEPAGPELGSRSLGTGAAWWRTAWGALVQTGPCRTALEARQAHFLKKKKKTACVSSTEITIPLNELNNFFSTFSRFGQIHHDLWDGMFSRETAQQPSIKQL